MKNLTLASLAVFCAASPAFAEDLTFVLNNNTSTAITQMYTSPTDVNIWEDDMIGGATLESGATAEITIADGRDQCAYDIRIVFADGEEITDTQDLCELGTYDVTE
jgi:hypothetical protein